MCDKIAFNVYFMIIGVCINYFWVNYLHKCVPVKQYNVQNDIVSNLINKLFGQ